MSSRTPIVAGNWKLNLGLGESTALAAALRDAGAARAGREVVVAPVFTASDAVARALRGSDIKVAARTSTGRSRARSRARSRPRSCSTLGRPRSS